MSVPTWKRTFSKTQYLHDLYNLNITIGHMVANLPTKYLSSYGTSLINSGLEALKRGQYINRLYIQGNAAESNYSKRRELCDQILGYLDHVSTVAYIYLEICRVGQETPDKKKKKLSKYEETIGTLCNNLVGMIIGLKKYDTDTIAKYRKSQEEKKVSQPETKALDI